MITCSEFSKLGVPDDVIVSIESMDTVNIKELSVYPTVKTCYDYEYKIPEDYPYQKRTEMITRFGTCYLIHYFCIEIGKYGMYVSYNDFLKTKFN